MADNQSKPPGKRRRRRSRKNKNAAPVERGPYKMNPDSTKRICEAILHGAPMYIAAKCGGINRGTLNEWLAKGRAAESGPYRNFFLAVEKARSECCLDMLRSIRTAAKSGDWRAAAWGLERMFPEQYAPNSSRFRPDTEDALIEPEGTEEPPREFGEMTLAEQKEEIARLLRGEGEK